MKKFIIFTIICVCFIFASKVFAEDIQGVTTASDSIPTQNTNQENIGSNSTLPLTFEHNANPGEIIEGKTYVSNFRDKEIRLISNIVDFEVIGEDGNVQLTQNTNEKHGLSSWIEIVEPDTTLKIKENKEINYKIKVPYNAISGAHWAILIVKSIDPEKMDANSFIDSITALILVTVGDGSKEIAEVKSLSTNLIDKKSASLVLKLSNISENFVKPKGKITLKNIWGKDIEALDLTPFIIYPNTVANIVNYWVSEQGLPVGYYNIEYSGYYGKNNTELKASTSIMIWPWQGYIDWNKYKWYLIGIVMLVICSIIYKLQRTDFTRKTG